MAADVSTLQPQVADLVQQVISNSAAADVKVQRRADALSATCSVVEALQRLLPSDGQAGLDGQAAALAEAAVQQQAALGSAPGKVSMSGTLFWSISFGNQVLCGVTVSLACFKDCLPLLVCSAPPEYPFFCVRSCQIVS